MQPSLDHIVLLVPHDKLGATPSWLTDAFTVLTGGAHADGLTENKLIVFADGVYVELIAFVDDADPQRRGAHRWGRRPEGRIIDWALTLLDPAAAAGAETTEEELAGAEEEFRRVQHRVRDAHAGIAYPDPVPGGRTRPDGVRLKWAVAGPVLEDEGGGARFKGGELPFWCFDRTPRQLRVPHTEKANVTHPCGALGLGAIAVFVKDDDLRLRLRRVYDAIAGHSSIEEKSADGRSSYHWDLAVPQSADSNRACRVTLSVVGEDSGPNVYVKFTLLSSSSEHRTIRGSFVEGWAIEIELVPAEVAE